MNRSSLFETHGTQPSHKNFLKQAIVGDLMGQRHAGITLRELGRHLGEVERIFSQDLANQRTASGVSIVSRVFRSGCRASKFGRSLCNAEIRDSSAT